jgi:hypothetical protein
MLVRPVQLAVVVTAALASNTLDTPHPTRKEIPPFGETSYKGRNVIERALHLERLAPGRNTI